MEPQREAVGDRSRRQAENAGVRGIAGGLKSGRAQEDSVGQGRIWTPSSFTGWTTAWTQ